jgi:mRNA-degrading endonuclease RelE of RelBE toxin-antitoxin system
MKFNVETTEFFDTLLKKLANKFPSLKAEISILIHDLEIKPDLGKSLGQGIFKIRIKIKSKNKGKSGGARVITYFYQSKQSVYLLSIYDKSDMVSIPLEDIKQLIKKLNL